MGNPPRKVINLSWADLFGSFLGSVIRIAQRFSHRFFIAMKKLLPDRSATNSTLADESRQAKPAPLILKTAVPSNSDSDRAVERGSRALARHARRKRLAGCGRWALAITVLLTLIGITGYLASSSIRQLPWQEYLDRFDFRLQPEGKVDGKTPNASSSTQNDDEP